HRRAGDHRLRPLHLAARSAPGPGNATARHCSLSAAFGALTAAAASRIGDRRPLALPDRAMASFIAPLEERRMLGIGLALIGFCCFTIIDSCGKWLIQSGLPPMQVVLIRYAGQFLLVSALFLPSRGVDLVRTRSPRLELLRGLCLLASTMLNFSALVFLPLTVTASIAFTMPLMLCALSIPFLGEHIGWRRWLAILTGFVGVLVIVQPGS